MAKTKFIVKNKAGRTIKIMQEPTDPLCLRASVGGTKEAGYYLVYRSDDMQEIEDMLGEVLEALKTAKIEYRKKFN